MLVLVTDDKTDRTACGHSFEQSRKNLNRIALLAGCRDGRLPRTTAVKLVLHTFEVYSDSCGHTVYHSADCCSVTFSKSGKSEYFADCVHFYLIHNA